MSWMRQHSSSSMRSSHSVPEKKHRISVFSNSKRNQRFKHVDAKRSMFNYATKGETIPASGGSFFTENSWDYHSFLKDP